MKGRSNKWMKCLGVCFLGLGLFGQQSSPVAPVTQAGTSSKPFHGKESELQGRSFQVDGFLVSLKINRPLLGGGGGRVELRIENSSSNSRVFNPSDLMLVNASGEQVQLWGEPSGQPTILVPFRLAPGAYTTRTFNISGQYDLKPTIKIYCGDSLLAEIQF